MADFQVFIVDDRYVVPTLRIVQAPNAAKAIQIAKGIFDESLHHLGVELYKDDRCIMVIGQPQPPAVVQRGEGMGDLDET